MPEINYNNPEFQGDLETEYTGKLSNNNYTGIVLTYFYPGNIFLDNYSSYLDHTESVPILGTRYYYKGSVNACITSFAQQGFLLFFNINFNYTGYTTYNGFQNFEIHLKQNTEIESGTGSIIQDTNAARQDTYFQIQSIKILSYRKRYIRIYDNYNNISIIHPNDGVDTFNLLGVSLYGIDISDTVLPLMYVFSIIPEQGTFYDGNVRTETDVQQFPIYKSQLSNDYYSNVNGTNLARTFLKNNGSHYLFNNNNKLQERDFNTNITIIGQSTTQQYNGIQPNPLNTSIYRLKNIKTQIMHKRTLYNKTASLNNMNQYHYFNNEKANSATYYTDLGDNNKNVPTYRDPLILYNNFYNYNEPDLYLTKKMLAKTFFGIDYNTLFFDSVIYYIPSSWEINIFRSKSTKLTTAEVDIVTTSGQDSRTMAKLVAASSINPDAYLYHPRTDINLCTITIPDIAPTQYAYKALRNNSLITDSDPSYLDTYNGTYTITQSINLYLLFKAGGYGATSGIFKHPSSEQPFNLKFTTHISTKGPNGMDIPQVTYHLDDINNYVSSTGDLEYHQNAPLKIQAKSFRPDGSRNSYMSTISLVPTLPTLNGICSGFAHFSQFYERDARALYTYNNIQMPYYEYHVYYGAGTDTAEARGGLEVQADGNEESYIIFAYKK